MVYDEFEVEAWSRKSASLVIEEQGESISIPTVSLGHSPVKATVTGELVNIGNGLEEDYAANPAIVKGKIALIYIGILADSTNEKSNLHRSEKAALAIQHGAIGVVIYNKVDKGVLLTGTASVTGEILPIPAVCIGKENGKRMGQRISNGEKIKVTIDVKNKSGLIKARNVIATIKGSKLPDEVIVIGGHLDSWDLSTGAIDNGIGSFAILDIARSFKNNQLEPKRTIKFVMFMGEEQGLFGSKHMVERLKKEGELGKVKYMVNLDMTGNPIGFNPGGRTEAEDFFKQLGKTINAVDTTFTNTFKNKAGLHSDHQAFMLEGIPFLSLNSNLDKKVYDCYHSDCDGFNLVNKEHITNTVRFGTMSLLGLANAPSLPAKPLNENDTKAFLEKSELKENLVMQGDWKW